jgi:glycosyltransferase involved in cell wall biosynthesis
MSGNYEKILVILPALNEALSIGSLCEGLITRGFSVLVVDDGSSDETGRVAEENGAFVVRHDSNRGKGAALRTGFAWALARAFDGVAIMDADGQHAVPDLEKLVACGGSGPYDLVLGERDDFDSMPPLRRLTNKSMSWILSRITGRMFLDSQCGLRLFSMRAISEMKLSTNHFEIETEILFQAVRLGWNIGRVPIRTFYPSEHRSHIQPVFDGVRWLRVLFGSLL